MIKKIIAFSFIAWAIAAVLSSGYAEATALIHPPDLDVCVDPIPELDHLCNITEVMVTPQFYAEISESCSRFFSYKQLMAIPGVGMRWVPVDIVYGTGPKEATLNLEEICEDGSNLYELQPRLRQ